MWNRLVKQFPMNFIASYFAQNNGGIHLQTQILRLGFLLLRNLGTSLESTTKIGAETEKLTQKRKIAAETQNWRK